MELLELYLSPLDAHRFRAIATRLPAGVGDAETECVLPFWVGEQDWRRTIVKVLESSQGFRAEHYPEPNEQAWLEQEGLLLPDRQSFHTAYLQRIGQSLYRSLFLPGSDLKQALLQSLRLAEQRNTDLHLRLKFAANSVERSRLADYPWELLHDGQRFLLHQRVRLSRYIAYDASPPSAPAQQSLRVLLVSARPQGLPSLSLEEQKAIQLGLQRAQGASLVQLNILLSPTRKALSRYLTDCSPEQLPQVLHFDGHGVFGKRCSNAACLTIHAGIKAESCRACSQRLPKEPQGYLVFETKQGQPDYQSAAQVAALLQSYPIALVVLSACQSGMAVAGDSVFNGMAQNLIDQRLPAVVAMQYSVQADAACEFAEQFYRVLGNKKPLLAALNQGIREMDVEGNQWYRPVLYLRWQDNEGGQLFNEAEKMSDPSQSFHESIFRTQRTAGSATAKQRRLEGQRDSLQAEWHLRSEKLKVLREALVIEAGVSTKFQLQQQIQVEERDLAQLHERLEQIEQALDSETIFSGSYLSASEDNPQPVLDGQPLEVKKTVRTEQASSSRKGFYERQIAQLEAELAAVESDLETAPREVDRLRLEKAAEQLLNKIEALKTKLHPL